MVLVAVGVRGGGVVDIGVSDGGGVAVASTGPIPGKLQAMIINNMSTSKGMLRRLKIMSLLLQNCAELICPGELCWVG
jgi:hypothetical protein